MAVGTILGSVNLITTIICMRALDIRDTARLGTDT